MPALLHLLRHGPKAHLRQVLGVSATTEFFNPEMDLPTEKDREEERVGKVD